MPRRAVHTARSDPRAARRFSASSWRSSASSSRRLASSSSKGRSAGTTARPQATPPRRERTPLFARSPRSPHVPSTAGPAHSPVRAPPYPRLCPWPLTVSVDRVRRCSASPTASSGPPRRSSLGRPSVPPPPCSLSLRTHILPPSLSAIVLPRFAVLCFASPLFPCPIHPTPSLAALQPYALPLLRRRAMQFKARRNHAAEHTPSPSAYSLPTLRSPPADHRVQRLPRPPRGPLRVRPRLLEAAPGAPYPLPARRSAVCSAALRPACDSASVSGRRSERPLRRVLAGAALWRAVSVGGRATGGERDSSLSGSGGAECVSLFPSFAAGPEGR